jgi:hypothetical protein
VRLQLAVVSIETRVFIGWVEPCSNVHRITETSQKTPVEVEFRQKKDADKCVTSIETIECNIRDSD